MKALMPILLILGGTAGGAGGGFAVLKVMGTPSAKAKVTHEPEEPTAFVPTGAILAPIVASDGHLSGYASFEVQLEVPASKATEVTGKLPLFLNAVNMRTYRAPMAAGPDNVLPDLKVFRSVLMEAAKESLGSDVKNAAVTNAAPS